MSSDVAVTHTNYILKYDWVHAELYKWDVTPAQLRKNTLEMNIWNLKKGRAPVSRRNKTNLEILASGSSSSISIDEKFLSLTPFLLKSNMTRRVSFTSPGIDDFFKQKKKVVQPQRGPLLVPNEVMGASIHGLINGQLVVFHFE